MDMIDLRYEYADADLQDPFSLRLEMALTVQTTDAQAILECITDAFREPTDDQDAWRSRLKALFNMDGVKVFNAFPKKVTPPRDIETQYHVQYDFDTRAGQWMAPGEGTTRPIKHVEYKPPEYQRDEEQVQSDDESDGEQEGAAARRRARREEQRLREVAMRSYPTPLEDLNGIVLRLSLSKWNTAEAAIRHMQNKYNIHKTLVSGYGMLQAGLTIQTSLMANPEWTSRMQSDRKTGTVDVHWIPRYMALSGTDPGTVDGQYQILGRSFVDTRYNKLPADWKVNFLGARATYPLLAVYSLLELRFAQMENVPLTSALAAIVQMMTSPYVVRDDYTDKFMHDVVSVLMQQSLHVKDREDSVMHRLLRAPEPARYEGDAAPRKHNKNPVWFQSMPQHAPKENDKVVTLLDETNPAVPMDEDANGQ